MTVTRSKLVQLVASSADISPRDAEVVLHTIVNKIGDALARGSRCELRSFGSFSVRERPARRGRNPRTGEEVQVDAKTVVHFRAGRQLLAILNGDPSALSTIRKKRDERCRRRDERKGQLSLF